MLRLKSSRTQKDVERLPTSQLLLLTPSLFLHAFQSLLLPALGLLSLLVAPALVEVLNHHTHEHVEHEERHNQQKGDEVQQHPRVVIHYWLKGTKDTGFFLDIMKPSPVVCMKVRNNCQHS